MAARKPSTNIQDIIIYGLIVGYVYAIILSASAIAVCESKRSGTCNDVWNQGYTTATGLITTFLAYLVPPGSSKMPSSPKREEIDASS